VVATRVAVAATGGQSQAKRSLCTAVKKGKKTRTKLKFAANSPSQKCFFFVPMNKGNIPGENRSFCATIRTEDVEFELVGSRNSRHHFTKDPQSEFSLHRICCHE
jgi:hypothetical protein